MLKSYVIIAFRNIRRNFSYAFLNVLGLTLGIAACLILFLIVRNELGYDAYNSKANRTYRVTLHALDYNSNVSLAVIPAMRTDFPELEASTQVFYLHDAMLKIGDSRYNEKNYAFADEQNTKVFDYTWLAGDAKTALQQSNSIVLTETLAKKYFGKSNAMGQLIKLNNDLNLKVTGVIKDLPGNTSMPLNFLVSLQTISKRLEGAMHFWAIPGGSYAYIVIPPHYSIHQLEKKMPGFIKKNWGNDIAKNAVLPLQPLKDIHFDQRYINSIVTPTSKDTYYALIGVALLIIITACINFINLATAQAIRRSKEVGVRKVLGATRSQLIRQFMGETTVMVIISVILGVALCAVFLAQAGKLLSINISAGQLYQPEVIGWITAITLLVILLAGLYPSFIQSAFQPVDSLKNKASVSYRGLTLRKSLVIAQFAISQILIVGTLIVAHQMDFFENQDLGFNKEAVVSVALPDQAKREVFKQQMQSYPGIKEISFSSGAPSYNNSFTSFSSAELGLTKDDVTEVKYIDEKYTDMFQLKMLAGQKIWKKNVNDTLHKIVINETMMQKLGFQNPQKVIDKKVTLNGDQLSTIVGVVQDFQSESKHKKRRACVLEYRPDELFMASIRIQPAAMNKTIGYIGKQWSKLFPDDLFKYEFIDEHIAAMYKQEQKVYTAFQFFSYIAILIGCLGLYGLIAFAASQRTKEVGIRKVLGASLYSIVNLFTREFIFLIGIAFLVAAPLGYYIMHSWLQNFAYHINIGPGIFIIAISASFIIAAITIAYQAIRAAMENPVKSLRNE
ncbi:ABC transporter permease [Mucilaginibacter pocheonensis]|uniref:ABC-type antimicrobial peptide transport system permease subunit n=1 Tax=Mucilaginibacter pocheonensis TaxID=398050 RepID=A0ABU1TCU3_9SPHI|nr:ABC transporter permease [Mucilaginibacter pocheonensis]MDR6943210.1 ABC-type antimicrobial peptide transport system permease subunit [Mucilaginibacter pocheonensis]